ncbi:MAG: Ig-like domain-containing protein [Tepidisphaerales bacterium]
MLPPGCVGVQTAAGLEVSHQSIAGLYAPKYVILDRTPAFAADGTLAPFATSGPTGLTPAKVRRAYGIDQIMFGSVTGDGTGQTIAIVDAYDYPTAWADLQAFDLAFGLPNPPSFTRVNQTGGSTMPGTDPAGKGNSWALEAALDIEWSHAMAPGAGIVLVEATTPSDADLIQAAAGYARTIPGVVAVTMSFGRDEDSAVTGLDTCFTTPAGHPGVTFLASTGDNGAPGGYPATSPNVVAVGGTTLTVDASGNYVSESGWSGSGGGISSYENQPTYQKGVVTQSSTRRTIPDVAFDANPSSGVSVCDSYDFGTSTPWTVLGGTSLSSPCWAGIIAVADQARSLSGLGPLDGIAKTLPRLYSMSSSAYHDIVTGSNGYSAGAGYDLVTGRGSPIANVLVPLLVGAGPLVTGSTPNGVVGSTPTTLDFTFNTAMDPASFSIGTDVAGFTGPGGIDLKPTIGGFAWLSAQSLRINFASSSAEGLYTMVIGPQILSTDGRPMDQDGDGIAGEAVDDRYTATFRYSSSTMGIVSTSPAAGSNVLLPMTTLEVNFTKPYDPASIGTNDLTLSQGSVAGFTPVDNDTVRYTLAGLTAEGTLNVSVAAGAVTDLAGNPGSAWLATYYLDNPTLAFPAPLQAITSASGFIYSRSTTTYLTPGDTDSFTISLDAGQALTIVADPGTGLLPSVAALDPSGLTLGSASAPGAGKDAVLQTAPVLAAGTYTVGVSALSGTSGSCTVQLLLNAAVEAEGHDGATNDTRATAQSIDGAFVALIPGSYRAAVVGWGGIAGGTALSADFTSGANGFTVDNSGGGLWHLSSGHGADTGHSSPQSFYYGTGESATGGGTYNTGSRNYGSLVSPSFVVPSAGTPTVAFNYILRTEGSSSYDVARLQINSGSGWVTLASYNAVAESATWKAATPVSIASYSGKTVQIRFYFDTVDSAANTYEGWYVDDVVVKADVAGTDCYSATLAAGEPVNVGLSQLAGSGAHVALQDAAGNTLASGTTGAGNFAEVIRNYTPATSGVYYLVVTAGTGADYAVVVTRNAALDIEANDSIALAQDMAGAPAAIGTIAVAGGSPTTVFSDGFESGTLGSAWSAYASDAVYGRTRVSSSYGAAGGAYAMLMDTAATAGSYNLNEAVLTVNLAGAISASLSFSTIQFADETDPMTADFTGHFNGDGVAISADGNRWHPVLSAPLDSTWKTYTIDLVAEAAKAGMSLGGNFKIKFQQYDNFPLTTDGRGWDNVAVTAAMPNAGDDYYLLSLTAGTVARLSTLTPGGGPGEFVNTLDPAIDLYDPAGNKVASDDNSAGDGRNAAIAYAIGTSGTWKVRIRSVDGTSGEYVLRRSADIPVDPTPARPDLADQSDTGLSSTDNLTRLNNSSPATALQFRIGNTIAGAAVVLFCDGQVIGSAAADGKETVIATNGSTILPDGAHVFTAVQTPAGSTTSPASAPLNVTIVATAPGIPPAPVLQAASDTGISPNDGITADTTPTLDINAGPYYRLYRNGSKVSGDYETASSFTSAVLPDGAWEFTVTAVDAAGNESAPGDPARVTIDTVAPATPAAPDLQAASDSGISSTDNLTRVQMPVIDVAGSPYYRLYRDGIRVSGLYDSTPAYVSASLTDGAYAFTLVSVDAAGNASPASQPLNIIVDTIAPRTPATPDLLASSDGGGSDTDNITNINTPTFAVTAGPYFRFYRDGVQISGDYISGTTYAAAPQADGTYGYAACAVDAAGNVSRMSARLAVTIDTTILFAPDLVAATDSGVSDSDNITQFNNSSPQKALQFRLANTQAGVAVQLYANDICLAQFVAAGPDSLVTCDESAILPDGTYRVVARQRDPIRKLFVESTPMTLTIDTVAPQPATLRLDPACDTGISSTDNLTSIACPQIDVNAEFYTLFVDGVQNGAAYGCGQAGPDLGQDGAHALAAIAMDVAGNAAPLSEVLTVTLDTEAPDTPPAPDLDAGSDSGISNTDNITNDNTPTFNITAGPYYRLYRDGVLISGLYETSPTFTATVQADGSADYCLYAVDAAGNVSAASSLNVTIDTVAPSAPAAPDLDASTDSGLSSTDNITNAASLKFYVSTGADSMRLFINGAQVTPDGQPSGEVTVASPGDGVWSFTTMAVDVAGNVSPASAALSVTVDTVAPAVPAAPDLQDGSDSGSSNTDNITRIKTPAFNVAAGPYFQFYRNGARISGTYQTGTSYTAPTQADGTWAYTVTAIDAAGNESAGSSALSVTIDTVAPAAPAIPDLQAASDSGVSSTDNVTNNTAPLVDLEAPEAGILHYVVDGLDTAIPVDGPGTVTRAAGGGVALGPKIAVATGTGTFDVAVADVNNDGIPDIIATNAVAHTVSVNLGNGDGTFQAAISTSFAHNGPLGIAAADFNHDGKCDVVVADSTDKAYVLFGNGAGRFTTGPVLQLRAGCSVMRLAAVDLNADGNVDVVAAERLYPGVGVVYGNGDGTFQPCASYDAGGGEMYEVAFADFNKDGRLDIAYRVGIAADWSIVTMLQDASGKFGPPLFTTTGNSIGGFAVGDYDKDGSVDLVASPGGTAGELYFLKGNGNGTFTLSGQSAVAAAGQCVSADFNADGNLDCASLSSTADAIALLLGNGDGTFQACKVYPTSGSTFDLVSIDFNADGRPDLAMPDYEGNAVNVLMTSPAVLADGMHTAYARMEDIAGNLSASSPSLTITVDTIAPAAPAAPDLQAASDSGISNTDNITNITNPAFSVSAGPYFRFYQNGLQLGGDYQTGTNYTLATQSDGTSSYSVVAVDAAGNASAPSPALSVTIDTVAPDTIAPTVPDLEDASDSGISNTDDLTNNATPGFAVTAPEAGVVRLMVDGAAGPAVQVAGPGMVRLTIASALSDGAHQVSAAMEDLAGNQGPRSTTLSVTIDTVAPAAPAAPDLEAASDSGISSTDNITNVKAPIFDVGATPYFRFYRNGTLISGGYETGTSYTLAAQSDGSYSFTVAAVDAAGNVSALSPALAATIDTVAPTVSVTPLSTTDATPPLSGSASENLGMASVTVDGSTYSAIVNGTAWSLADNTISPPLAYGVYDVAVTATDLAGNVASDTTSNELTVAVAAPATPDLIAASDTGVSSTDDVTALNNASPAAALTFLIGNTIPGAIVSLYANGMLIGSALASGDSTAVTSDGATVLADGKVSLIARQNLNGHPSADSPALTVTVDTIAPASPVAPDLQAASDSGISNTDNITNITTPTFAVSAGPYFRFYRDGIQLSGDYQAASTYTLASQADGTYSYTIASVDAAGNVSAPSAPLSVTIDTVAPPAPVQPDLQAGSDSGISNSDNITKVTMPAVDLIASEAGTLTVTLDGIALGTVAASGAGTYPIIAGQSGYGFATPVPYAVAGNPARLAVADLNGDGRPDIVTVNGDSISVLLNRGAGSFQPAVTTAVTGAADVAVADVNQDGRADLLVAAGSTNTVVLLLGNGDGTFQTARLALNFGAPVTSVAVADFNLDGRPDLVVGGPGIAGTKALGTYIGDGTGGFLLAGIVSNASSVTRLAIGNFGGDAYPDVVAIGSFAVPSACDFLGYRGSASGVLSWRDGWGGTTAYTSLAAGDFNNDGVTDFVVGLPNGTLELHAGFSGNVDTGHVSMTPSAVPTSAVLADVNGDGKADIVCTSQSNYLDIFLASGGTGYYPNFTRQVVAVATPLAGLALGDFNADGRPDLAAVAPTSAAADVFINGVALVDGVHTVSVRLTDLAGNISAPSPTLSITIDTIAPASPVAPVLQAASDSGVSNTDNITNVTTPAFTVAAGPYFQFYRNGTRISGTYQTGTAYTAPAQADGAYTYSVTAIDAAGNESAASTALSVTIDTIAPAAPAAPDLQAASDSGISNTDNITNITNPAFTVSASPYFRFYQNGLQLSGDYQTGTSYALAAQSDGTVGYAVAAVDAAGNVSALSPALSVTTDTVAPEAPAAPDLDASTDTGTSSTDNITAATVLMFNVTASPYFRLFRDGAKISGDYEAGSTYTTATQPLGTLNYAVAAVDAAGNQSALSPVLPVTINSLTVTLPASGWEGQTLTGGGTVQLGSAPTADVVVALGSSDTTELAVPATVTVKAGQTTATFNITLPADGLRDGTQAATVTATAAGLISSSPSLAVHDADLARLTFDTISGPKTAVVPFSVTIRAWNIADEAIAVYVGTASLSAAGQGGSVAMTPASATLIGGTWTHTVTLNAVDPAVTLSASVAGVTGTSNAFAVQAGAMAGFQWGTVSSPQTVNAPFSATLTAKDVNGFTATSFNGSATVSGWTGSSNTMLGNLASTKSNGDYAFTSGYSFTPTRNILVTHVRSYFGVKVCIWTDTGTLLASQNVSGPSMTWTETPLSSSLQLVAGTAYRITVYSTQNYYWRNDVPANPSFATLGDTWEIDGDRFPTGLDTGVFWLVDLRGNVGAGAQVPVAPTTATFINGLWNGNVTAAQIVNGMYLHADDGAGHTADSNFFDVASPPIPSAPVLASASDTGISNSDRLTNLNNANPAKALQFTVGNTTPGATVALYVNNVMIGSAGAAATTTTITTNGTTTLADGSVSIVARQAIGGVSSADSPAASVTVDTVAPATPVAPDLQAACDSGLSSTDNITNVATPTFTVAASPYFQFYRDGTRISGTYQTGTSYVAPAQTDGAYAYTVTAIDAAGNESAASAALNVTIDTIAPAVPPAPDLDASTDTGASDTDNITDATVLKFNVSASPYFRVVRDGTRISGDYEAGSSYTTTTQPLGTFNYAVISVDAAGNQSALSPALPVTITVFGPPAPVLAAGSDTGVSSTDRITQYNNSSPASALVFTVGPTTPDATVNLYCDGILIGSTIATGTTTTIATDGTTSLSDGTHSIVWREQPSGQAESANSQALLVTIDTIAPPAAIPDLDASSDTGVSSTDNITNVSAMYFNVAAPYYSLYIDGTLDGMVYRTGQTSASIVTDGTHQITAVALDAAGNASAMSAELLVTRDTAAPDAPAAPDLQDASDSGISNSDNITNAATPTFTVAAGPYFRFYRNGAIISGNYQTGSSYTAGTQADGSYTYTVAAVDAAGNVSAASSGLGVTIDTIAPTIPAAPDLDASTDTGSSNTDNITDATVLKFNVSANPYFRIFRDGARISGDYETGDTYTTATQPLGTFNYALGAVDVAGNQSALSPGLPVTITVFAPTIYVDVNSPGPTHNGISWATAYVDLQQALTAAAAGNTVKVADGTYKPTSTSDQTKSFQLKTGVAVYGGYAGYGAANPDARDVAAYPTILSGDIGAIGNNADNSYHVVVGSGTTSTAVLDGFTITAGNANGSSFPTNSGGGMYNSTGSPTVANCTFSNNTAGSTTSSNSGGAGMYNYGSSSPALTNCIFSYNVSLNYGGGMYNYSSSPTLTNCTFIRNNSNNSTASRGGGMYNNSSSPTLTNCIFTGNTATGATKGTGGGIYNDFSASAPTLINCVLTENWAIGASGTGGGMYSFLSSPTLINCTLAGNVCGGTGGGISSTSATLTLTNCILWGNSAPTGSQIQPSGTTNVNYCDIQGGGFAGTGNISADPLFIRNPGSGPDGTLGTSDDDYGDLRLRTGSPALNIGSNAAIPGGITTDVAGNARIQNGTVDLGAYEGAATVPSRTIYVDLNAAGAGTSWSGACASLQFALAVASAGDTIRVADGTYKPTTRTDTTAAQTKQTAGKAVPILPAAPAGQAGRRIVASPAVVSPFSRSGMIGSEPPAGGPVPNILGKKQASPFF